MIDNLKKFKGWIISISALLIAISVIAASPLRPMTVGEHREDMNHIDADVCENLLMSYIQMKREQHQHAEQHPNEPTPSYIAKLLAANDREATKHKCTYERTAD